MAKFKVGDKVRGTFGSTQKGTVIKVMKGSSYLGDQVMVKWEDGSTTSPMEGQLTAANSCKSTDAVVNAAMEYAKGKACNSWGDDEIAKARKMGVKERQDYLQQNGPNWVSKYGMKETKEVIDKIRRIRGKKIDEGRFTYQIDGGWKAIVDYTNDKWWTKKAGLEGTNVTYLEIRAPGSRGGNRDTHIAAEWNQGSWNIKPDANERDMVEKIKSHILHGPRTVKAGDDNYAWNVGSDEGTVVNRGKACNANVVPEIKAEYENYLKKKEKYERAYAATKGKDSWKESYQLVQAMKAVMAKWHSAFGKPMPSEWHAHPERLSVAPNSCKGAGTACNSDFPEKVGTYAKVKRPNGSVEVIDLSKRFFGMQPWLAKKIKEDTRKTGSEVLQLVTKDWKTNEKELEKDYRQKFLEGGEGYVPDFSKSPKFKKVIVTKEW